MKSFLKPIIASILRVEAKMMLRRYKPRIVAITGSVGKTSAKDAVWSVLSSYARARKSEKSFNSEIGLPLTILGLPNAWSDPLAWLSNIFGGMITIAFKKVYPEWLVLEVGADRPGDIASAASWISADVVILTRLPDVPVHVEFFSSPEEVRKEKLKLIGSLKKGGTLILNADDEYLDPDALSIPEGVAVIRAGFSGRADIRAESEQILYEEEKPVGMTFRVNHEGSSVPLELEGTLGRGHIYSILFALAAGVSQGKNLVELTDALRSYQTPPGRMKVISGIKETTIIDDTYNSSPVAAHEALSVLGGVAVGEKGRRIAALGDMMELGSFTLEEHKKLGEAAARACDLLITVGVRARHISDGARAAGMDLARVFEFDDSRKAGVELQHMLEAGDVVLAKGSQSIRMERLVEEIMRDPMEKEKFLVRQDPEWLRR